MSTFDARKRREEGVAARWTEREEHDDDEYEEEGRREGKRMEQ